MGVPGQRVEHQQVDDREQRPGEGEQPEPVGDLRVLVAADQDQRHVGQHGGGGDREGAESGDQGHGSQPGVVRRGPGQVREQDDADELREEQRSLGQDQPRGVQSAVVHVEAVAGDQRVQVAEHEVREQGVGRQDRFAEQRATADGWPAVGVAQQQPRTSDDGQPGSERDADHG